MRGTAVALVVVAVASTDDATAQILNRASQPPSALSTAGWTDHPIRPGVTSIKTTHFDELRDRVAALRARDGLPPVRWTDPVLTPGATVRRIHLAELRAALGGVYEARRQLQPAYMDRTLTVGRTPVRAAHIMELREAIEVLESPTPWLAPLAPYFTTLPFEVIDPSYRPHQHMSYATDLDGDGNDDLVLLGNTGPDPERGVTAANYRPQPGRVLLGDGDGGFRRAPAELFPVDTLNTVGTSRKSPFGDLNADGLPDMFLPLGGWDAPPFPGEQNRLYLSRPGGGWRDATSESDLPRLSDFSHSAEIGDIRGLGTPDIVVSNIWRHLPPEDQILPYALLNNGDETFSLDRSILPVGTDETFHFVSRGFTITGTVLADLDADGLPEMIALGEGHEGHPGIEAVSFVFWNRAGVFSERHKTPLPLPEVFAQDGHIDLDAAAFDIDGDDLLDLVIVGTQGARIDLRAGQPLVERDSVAGADGPDDPTYEGWFVQVLMNRGDGTFADETSLRLQPHEQSSGNAGVATGAPSVGRVDVLDFNGDGATDFAVTACCRLPPNQPLIWLNDGSGRFSALKVHDFIPPDSFHTWQFLLKDAPLVRTRHGYSFIVTWSDYEWPRPGAAGVILTGLLATRPYR